MMPAGLSPELRGQLLHGGLALFSLLLRAPQHVTQLLQMVQRVHQLAAHRLHLSLQQLRAVQRVATVSLAALHLLLKVLHCEFGKTYEP